MEDTTIHACLVAESTAHPPAPRATWSISVIEAGSAGVICGDPFV